MDFNVQADGDVGAGGHPGSTRCRFAEISVAILFALLCLGAATIWKGPSGEWATLALLPPFIVNVPAGVIALVIGLVARRGVARLRKVSIVMSVVALLSPFAAAIIGGLK